MKQSSHIRQENTASCMAAARSLRLDHRALAFAFLILVTIAGLCVIFTPQPGLSQGAQLVQVDVNVVAKGHRASKLIGRTVNNDKNERIGELDEIIIDRKNVLFAVLEVGGFLGIGGRLVAIPYQSLVIDDAGKKIELPGATREELRKLAEFKHRT